MKTRSFHRRIHALAATAALLAGCGSDSDSSVPVGQGTAVKDAASGALSWKILSGAAAFVSGGDALIELRVPAARQAQVEIFLNGARLDHQLHSHPDRLEGLVSGLRDGENILEAKVEQAETAQLRLTNYPITGPMFSGRHQEPFVCTATTEYGVQPLPDSASPPGFPVRDAGGRTIGYSRHCTVAPFVTYWYRSLEGSWKPMPNDGSRPADVATTVTMDGRTVDFVVRQERGTINRFLYSFAMLAPAGELPGQPDLSSWNRRLVYYFDGGVGVGHSQGLYHERAMEPTLLGKGYAIAYSSGNNTSTHMNLRLAAETAMMTKESFIERYGLPLYTAGLGASGGAAQQYHLAQNHPGVLDGLVPLQSYPDVITQTIHVADCELLEHYMDVTDRGNANWRHTKRRSWLVGFNAEEGSADLYDRWSPVKLILGYNASPGTTECSHAWRGLTPLMMNPHYGRAPNQELMEPPGIMDAVRWTHHEDLREIFGVDERGYARTTWDNVGVQYGLQSLKRGLLTSSEFLDLNLRVGGWKHPQDMVQEGLPLLGEALDRSVEDMLVEIARDRSRFDPWSRRNMLLSSVEGVPAPRTAGNLSAMRAAYTSGLVFTGVLPVPAIDVRHYLERELDMHNARQSFVIRKRVLQQMGHGDHLVIWFTDTRPGQPRFPQWAEALQVMDEWMSNIRKNPHQTVGQNRPPRAVDSCFSVNGDMQHAGPSAWEGALTGSPVGPCAVSYPLYGTPRTVAGAPDVGSVFRCALKSVDAAMADGTYSPWVPNVFEAARLRTIFPDGVCDYSKPDQARP